VVFVPLWVLTVLDSPAALGVVSAAYATGMILGNIVFAWLAPFLPRYPVLVAGYLIGGAPRFLVIALTDNLAVVVAVTFVSGFAMCSTNPTIGAMIFQRIPSDMLARVGGIITAVAFAGIPLGGLIGGALVQTLGLTNGVLLATAIYFVVTMAPIAGYRLWRELNDASPKKPSADDAAALPRLYAVSGLATGPRVTLRYTAGEWTLRARHGLRTLVRRRPVPSKVAISALAQLDVAPVEAAVREVLAHDRVRVERRVQWMRAEQARVEAKLRDLQLALTRD
jgi:MFS family permease